MPVRLGRFEMPKRLSKEETTATDVYAKFIAEPFETGYGHTIGNSIRRVLLSSLEGAAITSVKIDGAMHEFTTVDGAVEDVTDIVLNLKQVKFRAHSREPQSLLLSVNREGAVTAADIELNQNIEIVIPISSSAPWIARRSWRLSWRFGSDGASAQATRTRNSTNRLG